MAKLKGLNLTHTRAFVESAYGMEGWASVAAELSKESRDAIESAVAVGWYPVHLQVDLLHAIDASLARTHGGKSLMPKAGEHGADFDLTRVHRVLMRLANPGYMIEKVSDIWGRFYDTGTWLTERPTPTSVRASLRDFAIVDSLYCAYLTAYFRRLIEIVGAHDVTSVHSLCRARGDAECRWDGQWR